MTDLAPNDLFALAATLRFSPPGDGPRRFSMEAYDGGLLRLGLPHPLVVDLSGMEQADQVKALLHHDPARPVGHMDEVRIGSTIRTSGVLSVPEHASIVEAAQKEGFAWEASIGASIVPGTMEVVPAGRSVTVNGRTFRGPVIVARRSVLREVSFTGLGAGEHTQARIAAALALTPPGTMDPNADNANHDDQAADTGRVMTELRALRASLQSESSEIRRQREEIAAQLDSLRRERLTHAVDRIAAQYGCDDATLLASLRDKARSGEIAETEIELHVLRAQGNQRLKGFLPVGAAQDGPAMPHVIEAALCLTSGWSERELSGHFDANTITAAIGNRWVGFGLHALGVEYLRAHGHHVLGGKLNDDDVRQAVQLAEQEGVRASAGYSTVSLPGILSNVARKELVRGYETADKAILTIAKQTTAADYKPFYMYRLNTSGLLEQIGPDGELKSMELQEDEYQSRVYPFGRKLALTHVMFRNDDLGVFRDLARLFGITGARTLERTGFKTLLGSQDTFWTTGKGNRLASGAGSALGMDSLRSAYNLFLKFKDSTGEPIGLRPRYLLTASGDYVLARDLNRADRINLAVRDDADADQIIERPANNSFQGMFDPLFSPYLDNGVVTNANGTQWLLCADPAITSPIVVAFLDGRAAPQIKPWESLPGRLGMQWDCTLHFGFNLHDDKGAVYSPGQ